MREIFFPSFAHIYGIVSGVLLPAFVGSYTVCMRTFDFDRYVQRCSDIGATIMRVVPPTAVRMVKDAEFRARNLNLKSVSSVMCSGAALSSEIVVGLRQILSPSASVLNGYGMSETTIALLRETQSESKAGSVGLLAADVEIRIVDDNGNDVEPGVDGECWVKAPTMFMGYKDNAEETRNAFKDGWLCTGDVIKVDEDGYFWLTGRKKELIKYKGNQISPPELEAVLLEHPKVSDAGVCGIIDQKTDNEVPAAVIILSADVSEAQMKNILEEIEQFVNERVSPYKKLRGGIYCVETLPKGSTGKLLRREIPAQIYSLKKTKAKL
jgi:4-coumarate--CoA ligase